MDKSILDSKVRMIDWLLNKMFYNRFYVTGSRSQPTLRYLFKQREDLPLKPTTGINYYFVIGGDFDSIRKIRVKKAKNQLKLW